MGREQFLATLGFASRYLDLLANDRGILPEAYHVLEIGTGWHPVQPIAHFLCGADHIRTVDIDPLLNSANVGKTLQHFRESALDGTLLQALPRARLDRIAHVRMQALGDPRSTSSADLLQPYRVFTFTGQDWHKAEPPSSLDFSFSHSVLEYIPLASLRRLFHELRSLTKTTGVTAHFVSLKDQFSVFDSDLSPFNYLRYSSRMWKYLDSPLIPQSRLRSSDYLSALSDGGWTLFHQDSQLGKLEDLASIPLAAEFQSYTTEDLRVLRLWLAARLR